MLGFTRFDIDALRFGDQGFFVTREWFLRVEGYPSEYLMLADQEMVRRLKTRGAKFRVVEDYITTAIPKYIQKRSLKLGYNLFLLWLSYYLGESQARLAEMYRTRIMDTESQPEATPGVRHMIRYINQVPRTGRSENTTA